MSFRTLGLSVATVGMATLAFAIAAPASAQQYGHTHHAGAHHARIHHGHARYAHARHRHYARHDEGRQIVVHAQEPARSWGPVGAAGSVVAGTGQAVQSVFVGAGGIVGGVLGGVFGGVSALFGGPGYTYVAATGHGGPFAAPFNAAGSVAGAPFQVVSGAFEGNQPLGYTYAPATGAPAYGY